MDGFNVLEYLHGLQQKLNATKNYEFCRVSDPKMMEEVIMGSKRATRFFAVDDSQEGILFEGDGGGWFERRPVVVFLLGKLNRWPDMDGRARILNEVRDIYRKIISRLVRDSRMEEALDYLNTEDIPFDEVPGEYSGGTAGIFFTFTIDIPVNMEYNESDWN